MRHLPPEEAIPHFMHAIMMKSKSGRFKISSRVFIHLEKQSTSIYEASYKEETSVMPSKLYSCNDDIQTIEHSRHFLFHPCSLLDHMSMHQNYFDGMKFNVDLHVWTHVTNMAAASSNLWSGSNFRYFSPHHGRNKQLQAEEEQYWRYVRRTATHGPLICSGSSYWPGKNVCGWQAEFSHSWNGHG